MSTALFPDLPGLRWSVTKRPLFATSIQKSASGREQRAPMWSYPQWRIDLQYEFLRDDATAELQTLMGFFLARQGSFDSFNYLDPDDNAVVAQTFGVGDGIRTAFQLARTYAGFAEPVYRVSGAPSIYKAGVLQSSGYTVSAEGVVTFATAPAGGVALTWTGSFYYRVRFEDDAADFEKFMAGLWSMRKLSLVTVK